MFLNALVSAGSKPLKILCGSAHPDDRDFEVSASGHGVKRRKNLLIRQVPSCAKENKCIRFKTLHLKSTLLMPCCCNLFTFIFIFRPKSCRIEGAALKPCPRSFIHRPEFPKSGT